MIALLPWVDATPADDDVVAGPWGALMFVLLILAVVFLGFSLVKQLRKTRSNAEAGVFGEDDADGADPAAESGTDAGPAGPGEDDVRPG